jgi:hypothetical protein
MQSADIIETKYRPLQPLLDVQDHHNEFEGINPEIAQSAGGIDVCRRTWHMAGDNVENG